MTELTTPSNRSKSDVLSRPLLMALSLDWEKATYILFLLIAILSRFWGLGDRVMSHDESLHTQFSYQFYDGQGFAHTPLMHGPFLFHITAISYWLFGDSDFSARAPVALFGIILVLIPYFFRNWIGRIGALFTSFIFLISPYLLYYSRYIRHDIYVITWALIIVVSMWFYFREQKDKYLWWFAAGNALMFCTKEVSFIYVAIFGGFLIIRLLPQIITAPWLSKIQDKLLIPVLVVVIGVVLAGGSFLAQRAADRSVDETATTATSEGFAVDPNAATSSSANSSNSSTWGWLTVTGIVVAGVGMFLTVNSTRPYIDQYPEFDLIVLFSTLILPMVAPFFVSLVGWNPNEYTMSTCMLAGQETMTPLQIFFDRLSQATCRQAFFSSGLVHSGSFLLALLAVSLLVGMWWQRRRFLIAAAIFHVIFAVLYTSVFTNLGGWASGMIGSLGYWLEQQSVQRGNQPGFYYFFVTPFYEFMPLIFSLLAIRLFAKQQKLNRTLGYWITLVLISLLSFSLVKWVYLAATGYNSLLQPPPTGASGLTTDNVMGLIAALFVLGIGILFWFFAWRRRLQAYYEQDSLLSLINKEIMCEFMPFLVWWLTVTWVAYSYAGEKMPWLSTHFVIPMGLLAGWYFNEKFKNLDRQTLLARETWQFLGLTIVLIVAVFLIVSPLWLGKLQLGSQQVDNLKQIGRFLGSLLAAGGVFYLWRMVRARVAPSWRHPVVVFGWFIVLSLLTARAAYAASFPNADYTTEFMVYAHGAPATKEIVMKQVEELSMRMYGDKSIKVAFSSDVSWPYTWYLRDYPNRVYFGETPSQSLNESPIVIVGRNDWEKVEPYLTNNFEYTAYTFLWWPMEEYRRISWNAIFGDPNAAANGQVKRGLGNAAVREALYDIFFYRDYSKFQQVFGGQYTASEWPLRHELRLYIRKDALANLWDYGVGAVFAEGLTDPYEAGELVPSPTLVINESGIPGSEAGQLTSPRNLAVGTDGHIYVADSGNHRIQVFAVDGTYITSWGEFGTAPGQFNEPWGIAVDENFVYVADTWNHRIQKFTLDGAFMGVFGQSGSVDGTDGGLGLFFGPRDVALLPNNQLLVTDTGNHRMQVLTRDGEFLQQVGSFGSQLGQFNEPVGLDVAPDGSIFLVDTWNGRMQQFDGNLFPITDWPVNAWVGQSINNKPYPAIDSLGRVYVTDPEGYRVLIFTANGDYLARFGKFGTDINSMGLPNGIVIDAQNNIYIADSGNNRVLKFAPIFGAPQPELPPVEEVPGESSEDAAAPETMDEGQGIEVSPTPTDEGQDMEVSPTATDEVIEPSPSSSPMPTATTNE